MKKITDPRQQGHKEKTSKNKIHKNPASAGEECESPAGPSALLEIYPRAEADGRRSTRLGVALTFKKIQEGRIISANAIAAEYACQYDPQSRASFSRELLVSLRDQQLIPVGAGGFGPPPRYDATASSAPCGRRCMPFRGPRLRALLTLMHSSSSNGEQVFLASSASAAWI